MRPPNEPVGPSHESTFPVPMGDAFIFGEPLNVATFNAYGLRTVPQKSLSGCSQKSHRRTRLQYLIQELSTSRLAIVGIQEPIFRTPEVTPCCGPRKPCEFHEAVHQLEDAGFSFIANFSPQGRGGGVGLRFSKRRTVESSMSFEPRALFVRLRHDTGQLLHVLVVHFHHHFHAGQSPERMWGDVSLFLWDADAPALTLCDQKPVVLPGYDSEQISSHDALRHVLAAREREVMCLGRLGVVDA